MIRSRRIVGSLFVLLLLRTVATYAHSEDAGPSQDEPPLEEADDPEVTGLPDDALKKLAIKKNEEALERLNQKDYPGALALIQAAYDLDGENPEISGNFGHIYALLGNDQEAERLFRKSLEQDKDRFATHINLADILGREGENATRLTEAATLLERARELKGNRADVILKQARVAKLQGADNEAERFYGAYLENLRPTDRLKIEIGDFFRDLGRTDEALTWYQKVRDEKDLGKEAASRIWDIEVERQARQFGWSLPPDTIPTKARTLASKGQVQLNRRRFKEAERLLKGAVDLAPGFAKARTHLGDVYRATGRVHEAELAFLRALAMENNAETCYRLGTLYLEDATPPRNAEAALFLARALDYRPDWADLRFSLARALRAIGDMAGAARQLDIYLAGSVEGEKREDAIALKQTLSRLKSQKDLATRVAPDESGSIKDAELVTILAKARAHLSKGRPEAAMAELKRVEGAKRIPPVLNLEAQILFSSGRKQEARAALEHSLRKDGEQGEALEQMGLVQLALGNPNQAAFYFEKAKSHDVASAGYHLVYLAISREVSPIEAWFESVTSPRALFWARAELETFLGHTTPSVYQSDAEVFLKVIRSRIRTAYVSWATFFTLIAGLFFYWRWRRTGGHGLAALLKTHPEAGPDVQRILSAIGHEILKHNTMVLGGLIDAIDKNKEDAGAKAQHFLDSLRGTGGREPMRARLEFYASELSKIGRSYKFRLNLKHRDPAVSALMRGFILLENASSSLDNYGSLKSGARQKLRATLKAAALLLNETGYNQISELLDGIRTFTVHKKDISEIAERIQAEPGFAGKALLRVSVTSDGNDPINISLPRQVFEDIMANLIRNALQSSKECAVHVMTEVDAITGIERAVFLVRDKSKKKLDLDMIRTRNIEGGLGLTSVLVSRHEGTLDVVDDQGEWTKSVRVKLPVADK
ncbi:MAG: tetratricopeptide repeat protein [Myxococcota bacterium]|nr:tetratricopeptide repeat protein [Myxococcota bacterium]